MPFDDLLEDNREFSLGLSRASELLLSETVRKLNVIVIEKNYIYDP